MNINTNIDENRNENLVVSGSPHIFSDISTRKIMVQVLIALIPAFGVSIVVFGSRVIFLLAVCLVSCILFEWLFEKITKRQNTVRDMSAAVTGALLAFSVPPTMPYWMMVVGSFVAIVIVKQLFGGIGSNFANPANTARVVLFISFSAQMSAYPPPGNTTLSVDAITSATPLGILAENTGDALPSYLDMFIGNIGGCVGEVSALALIIGGVFLVIRKIISPAIPVAFIATVFAIALIAGQDPLFHILAGGVMIGAIFMATDYATSPITFFGKIVFGIGCGIFTMLIRLFGVYPEGVSFAILLMNILCPYIDAISQRLLYGKK
jgi:electron transport complex protein RnfD